MPINTTDQNIEEKDDKASGGMIMVLITLGIIALIAFSAYYPGISLNPNSGSTIATNKNPTSRE